MVSPNSPSDGTAEELTQLEKEIVDHFFVIQPGYAVFLGLHKYDGVVPDWSTNATDSWVTAAERLLKHLKALPSQALPTDRQLDRILLGLLLESPLFDLQVSHDLERNPMSYVSAFSLTSYMVREYAPPDQRVQAMARILEAVPTVLTQGRKRLEADLPKPFLQLTFAIGGGLPAHFAEAEAFAMKRAPNSSEPLVSARPVAEAAITEFLARLRDDYLPHSTDDFALGAKRYQRLLWVREGIETPFQEILAQGRADLRRNQQRLEEIARSQNPPAAVDALLERLYQNHPTAQNLVPSAQRLVEEARKFVASKGLVTIPEPAVCRVEETPVYGRALSTASMNPPGPFDETGDEGIYFVTPVDPAWTPERQEEWLRSLNDAMLRNITIHEVFPGHYLQFLHFRRSAGSLTRKVYLSASFTEGWAHYAEQIAIEQGLGNGTSDAEVAQIHDALLRDCRLIASIGLHTQGMTLPEATQLFRREAHFEELPAEREAIRGTFNPEYFCYTLGKLAILQVRAKYLSARFGGSLRAFHDALLGFGCPPIGVLDSLLAAS